MADFFYRSVSDAWQAWKAWMDANVLNHSVSSSGFNAFLNNSYGTTNLFWIQVDSALPSSPDRFYMAEAVPAVKTPLQAVMRQPGFLAGIVGSYTTPASGLVSYNDAVAFVYSIWQDIHRFITQASVLAFTQLTVAIDGTNTSASFAQGVLRSDTDVMVFSILNQNNAYPLNGLNMSEPAQLVYPSSTNIPIPGQAGVVINSGPPLDADVGINYGQAILSVTSRTITIPP